MVEKQKGKVKCRDCKFISERTFFEPDSYGGVRCTLGLWDQNGQEQWYSFGSCTLNLHAVKRFGAVCTRGETK